MLSLLALAVTASAQAPGFAAAGPVVQARATVQIISGVRLTLDGHASTGAPAARDSIVHADGVARRARLIEFQ